jgi:hypothetical protein
VKRNIEEKVKLHSITLQNITAQKNEIVNPVGEVLLNVKINPEIREDKEKTIIIICKFDIGGSDQPFTIHSEIEAVFKKNTEMEGNELLSSFSDISFPILSEGSLIIAQVVSAMNYPPLIISPEEYLASYLKN